MRRREYNIIVNEHSNSLFGYAMNFLHDREDAEDIVQDVFEKLWVNRGKVEPTKAKSWMFTTAHNAMINFSTRKSRMSFYDEMERFEKGEIIPNSFEANEVVNRAVSILPPIQKSIIILRDLEGYSYGEVGEILDLSESQVKVYLFRGRRKIKKQLKGLVELV
ncbi:MAG: RNA polymerase sigma factor [Crocinitomicaceae bacterium]|nr:RNA polymerase sigma factor [Crocinitomicaceae bacterium]